MAIEYREAAGETERLAALAADLVGRRVTVIATQNIAAASDAKAATSNIPIIFSAGADPVQLGFVTSLNRPGGNMTGVAILTAELMGKRLELLHEFGAYRHCRRFAREPNKPRRYRIGD